MTKLKMQTPDLMVQNIDKIAKLFSNCLTETVDENGQLKRTINFEMLKQMLSDEVLEGERLTSLLGYAKKRRLCRSTI